VTGKRRQGRDRIEPPAPDGQVNQAPSVPPVPPPPPDIVTVPALSRRQARIERRNRRRKAGVAGIAVVVLIGLVIIGAIAFGVHRAVAHHNHPSAPQAQQTVLLQIQGADRSALGTALLAHDPSTGNGVELVVPSQLITDVCGVGQVDFGQTLAAQNGSVVSRQAVSAALGGITIDGSWVLSTTDFAKLVDAVGGVTVDVDTNVISHGTNGSATIDIPSGSQHLDGAKATEYATYRASADEDASAQLLRLSRVVDATVRALSPSTGRVSKVLAQLGPTGASTLGAARLTTLLAGLAADSAHAGGVTLSDLPVNVIDTGGTPSYSVDTGQTTQLVEHTLKRSLPEVTPGHRISVELRNGVGPPGLVATACPKLAAAGLVYAGQGNAATFNNPHSEVQIGSDSATDLAQGATVAHALGLPPGDVRLAQLGQDDADVVVILGKDYRPAARP
jgi:hypothetical protein